MLKYKITEQEKNFIEALYYEKNAKEFILKTIMSNDKNNTELYSRVLKELEEAHIKFSFAFNEIVSKYVPKNISYKDAQIRFIDQELIVTEE